MGRSLCSSVAPILETMSCLSKFGGRRTTKRERLAGSYRRAAWGRGAFELSELNDLEGLDVSGAFGIHLGSHSNGSLLGSSRVFLPENKITVDVARQTQQLQHCNVSPSYSVWRICRLCREPAVNALWLIGSVAALIWERGNWAT